MMSTATSNHQPTPYSSPRRMVARHPVTAFLLMAYTIGWTIQLVAFQLGLPRKLLRAGQGGSSRNRFESVALPGLAWHYGHERGERT